MGTPLSTHRSDTFFVLHVPGGPWSTDAEDELDQPRRPLEVRNRLALDVQAYRYAQELDRILANSTFSLSDIAVVSQDFVSIDGATVGQAVLTHLTRPTGAAERVEASSGSNQLARYVSASGVGFMVQEGLQWEGPKRNYQTAWLPPQTSHDFARSRWHGSWSVTQSDRILAATWGRATLSSYEVDLPELPPPASPEAGEDDDSDQESFASVTTTASPGSLSSTQGSEWTDDYYVDE